MNNSLFYIEAPFQLLSAYEAIGDYNLKQYKIIVRLSGVKNNDNQILNLVKILFEDDSRIEYIFIKITNRRIIDYLKIVFLIIKSYTIQYKYQYIFIGNLESKILAKIVRIINKEKVILLDDGIKSITFQNNFSNKYYYNLYTMLDKLKTIEKQKIVYNKFSRLQLMIKGIEKREDILFIGSKLSEAGIVTEEYYINMIKKISLKYSKKNILYITHRGEMIDKLNKLSQCNNIKIIQLDYPIEFFPIYYNYLPSMVISFYSAALISLYKIYPTIKIESYLLKNIDKFFVEDIYNSYKYIEQYIEVIKIDD
jgi:hypothetical protein